MTLDGKAAKKYGIDLNLCRANLDTLLKQPGLAKKIQKVFTDGQTVFEPRTDPDQMLYGGPFFNDDDKARMAQAHTLSPQALADYHPPFSDGRLSELLFRMRARNWPETLNADEQLRWQEFRQSRINLDDYLRDIELLRQEPQRSDAEQRLLDTLEQYGREISA